RRRQRCRRRNVEKVICARALRLQVFHLLFELLVEPVLVDVAGNVVQPLFELLPVPVAELPCVLRGRSRLPHRFAEFVRVHLGAARAQHVELLPADAANAGQVVERRDQLALRQVAGSPENHHQARIRLGHGWNRNAPHRSRLNDSAHERSSILCERISASLYARTWRLPCLPAGTCARRRSLSAPASGSAAVAQIDNCQSTPATTRTPASESPARPPVAPLCASSSPLPARAT